MAGGLLDDYDESSRKLPLLLYTYCQYASQQDYVAQETSLLKKGKKIGQIASATKNLSMNEGIAQD